MSGDGLDRMDIAEITSGVMGDSIYHFRGGGVTESHAMRRELIAGCRFCAAEGFVPGDPEDAED